MDKERPYLGLKPFERKDAASFFGRKKEIGQLIELIELSRVALIYGKSGIGKSSLIEAGLIPALQQRYYLPITIRINYKNKDLSPLQQAKKIIQKEIDSVSEKITNNGVRIDNLTLWEFFHQLRLMDGLVKPVLFFDQFEELFRLNTGSTKEIREYIDQLIILIENWLPKEYEDRLKSEGKFLTESIKEKNYCAIFSLREDYLPQFDSAFQKARSLTGTHRYRLVELIGKYALDAITGPAKQIIEEKTAIEILKEFPSVSTNEIILDEEEVADEWKLKGIEPFMLSLYCERINELRIEDKSPKITEEHLKKIKAEDVLKHYYSDVMKGFPEQVQIAIEDELLTTEGYRLMQSLDDFKKNANADDTTIDWLVDKHILRRERRSNVFYIELIHDQLAKSVFESKCKRSIEKKKKEFEEENRKLVRKTKRILIMVPIIIGICVIIGNYYLQQKRKNLEASLSYKNQRLFIDSLNREITIMKRDSATINKEINLLLSQNNVLLEGYSIDVGKKKNYIDNLSRENAIWKMLLKQLRSDSSVRVRFIDSLQNINKTLNGTITDLSAANYNYSNQSGDLRKQLSGLNNDNLRLRDSISKYDSLSDKFKKLVYKIKADPYLPDTVKEALIPH